MKVYRCNCGSEAIHIEFLEWNNHSEIAFSIWFIGSENAWTFREKLRHCWHVLRTGKPYPDQICLYPADALELANDLTAMAQKAEGE